MKKKTPNNFDCIVFTTFLSTTAIVEAAIAPHRLLLTILKVPGSFLCDLSGMIVCTSTTPRSFSTSSSLEELQGQKFSEAYYIVWFLFGVWRTALTTFFFALKSSVVGTLLLQLLQTNKGTLKMLIFLNMPRFSSDRQGFNFGIAMD